VGPERPESFTLLTVAQERITVFVSSPRELALTRISPLTRGRCRWHIAFGACFLLATACVADSEAPAEPRLERELQLRAGESAVVAPAGIEVTFLTVQSDSRCGKGEQCIWEGDAVVVLQLDSGTASTEKRLLHTATTESSSTFYAGHTVRLVALLPPPETGRAIPPENYVAVLRVVRGNTAEDNYH
jgi:hypothetical protein